MYAVCAISRKDVVCKMLSPDAKDEDKYLQ